MGVKISLVAIVSIISTQVAPRLHHQGREGKATVFEILKK